MPSVSPFVGRRLSLTHRAAVRLVVKLTRSFLHIPSRNLFCLSFGWQYLLHAQCEYVSRLVLVEGFSYTSRDGICVFVRQIGGFFLTVRARSVSSFGEWGVSLTRPVLVCVSSMVGEELLLRAP